MKARKDIFKRFQNVNVRRFRRLIKAVRECENILKLRCWKPVGDRALQSARAKMLRQKALKTK